VSVLPQVSWGAQPLRQAMARVGMHSMVYAPASIAANFAWVGMSRGLSIPETLSCAAPNAVVPVWAAGSFFWVPTMLYIYRFVPLDLRVVVTAAANIVWAAYLSMKSEVGVGVEEKETGTGRITERGL